MIICRTPFRVSFFGGGTDFPAWYRDHGGAVLAATIDKYCYLTCRRLPPFFDHRFRVVYRQIETCHLPDEIEHPVVKAVLQHLRWDGGLELHHDGDLPARSGMGSSSAFTVGLLHTLHALRGYRRTKTQLAEEAVHIEQTVLKETVGSQDQVMAAFGGLNCIQFHRDGRFSVDPVPLRPGRRDELQSHLMLFFTGVARTSSDVAQSYATDLASRARQLKTLRRLVDEGIDLLVSGQDIRAFGELLDEGWRSKRTMSDQVSNAMIDDLYRRARNAGAIGGKITGAGGGGFLLLFAPPRSQAKIRRALKSLLHVPFELESVGSQIVFYDPAGEASAGAETKSRKPPVKRSRVAPR